MVSLGRQASTMMFHRSRRSPTLLRNPSLTFSMSLTLTEEPEPDLPEGGRPPDSRGSGPAVGTVAGSQSEGPKQSDALAQLSVSRNEGNFVPQAVSFESDAEDVELLVERAEDGSAFVALLLISGPTAPTEYHFDLAIPQDHTAFIESDGSISVTNVAGGYEGTVAAPCTRLRVQ